MNWGQFKDPVCYLCVAGTVVASWPLMQEVVGLNNLFKYNIFVTEISEFTENIKGKLNILNVCTVLVFLLRMADCSNLYFALKQ